MERALSSLTYKGSIPEAIVEAKNQKKLLVVYISGKDTESINLENSTWTDLKVAESLLKYCILLHIPEGSNDATNFCAIYPQNSAPCVTAIGYNGVEVWKSEGFVSAEVMASSLEKAWLNLHIQETTATVLTAALASKKSELPTPETSVVNSAEQGSSSCTGVSSSSSDKKVQSSEARSSVKCEVVKEKNTELGVKTSSKSFSDSQPGNVGDEKSNSSTEAAKNLVSPLIMTDQDSSGAEHTATSADHVSPPLEKKINHHSAVPRGGSLLISAEANEVVKSERAEGTDDGRIDALGNGCIISELSDVHLNIRLPNGVSLQEKFSLTSTLRMVKDYVDRNQACDMSSYDLAIPYPRKVFGDEDLSKSLSELSLFNRQALMVVPHQRASGYHKGGSSSSGKISSTRNADSSNGSEGGYFAYIRTILSYVNPFSYFSGGASSSSSAQDSQTGMWEYNPNPVARNNIADADRPNHSTSTSKNDSRRRQPTTSRFGSNIHTLKHDEDDDRFSDRNAFWNGNSTQYGGDNNDK